MLGDHPVTMVSALTSSAAASCTMVDRSGVAVLAVLEARTDAVTCDCPAGARGQACSHAAAAMVRWHERTRNAVF